MCLPSGRRQTVLVGVQWWSPQISCIVSLIKRCHLLRKARGEGIVLWEVWLIQVRVHWVWESWGKASEEVCLSSKEGCIWILLPHRWQLSSWEKIRWPMGEGQQGRRSSMYPGEKPSVRGKRKTKISRNSEKLQPPGCRVPIMTPKMPFQDKFGGLLFVKACIYTDFNLRITALVG